MPRRTDRHKELASFDENLREHHEVRFVIGVDEVGRGCLAGPVCAAAVAIDPSTAKLPFLDDSKRLSEALREKLYDQILDQAAACHVWWVWPEEIDAMGINPANALAMESAAREVLNAIGETALFIIDQSPSFPFSPHVMMAQADSKSLAVAAASVVAKVERDRYMTHLSDTHPAYGLDGNKGYGGPGHIEAIRMYGRVKGLHRYSFKLKSLGEAASSAVHAE
jgi:ribonuclease HII